MATIPGVPALQIANLFATGVRLLTGDALALLGLPGVLEWGIFQDGIPVVIADSVVSFGFKQEWSLSTYPLEEGGFESYNKVNSPFDARVRYATGGSAADRKAMLDSIDAIAGTLDLFDVVTPEAIYTSVNIAHYDYHRTATNGAGLLQVDIFLLQVIVTATSTFSNTKTPAGANPVGGGNILPQTPTAAQQAQIPAVQ